MQGNPSTTVVLSKGQKKREKLKLKNQVAKNPTAKNITLEKVTDASTETDDRKLPHPDADKKFNTHRINNNIKSNPANPTQLLPQRQTISLEFVQLPKAVYDELLAENINLKQQLLTTQQGEKILQQTIRNGELTIAELRNENEKLKVKIAALESQMEDIVSKNSYNTFSVAVIDLINGDKILDRMSPHIQPVAIKLKKKRIADCHYLNHDDEADVIGYKRYVLHEKLRSMPVSIRASFSRIFPGVIDEIELYLNTYPPALVAVSEDVKEEVIMWWK